MAENLALFDDNGDLNFTKKAPDVISYVNLIEEGYQDNQFGAHRTTNCNSEFFRWQCLGDYRTSEQELIQGIHNFVAIRGIPIGFSFGFAFYDGIEKKMLCRTTRYESVVDGELKVTSSPTPLLFPVFQPHQSKDKLNQYNYTLVKAGGVLYGSRKNEDGSLLQCRQCVESKMHIIDNEKQTSTCSSTGNLLFVVFQMAKLEFDRATSSVKLEWIPVEELGIDTINRPFVLRIERINRTSMFSKFGTGERDLKILNKANDKMSYVPSDVITAGEYFKYIHSDSERCLSLPNGQAGYLYPTDIFIAKVHPKSQVSPNTVAYPAFKPIEDPSITKYSFDMLKTAWRVYLDEKEVYSGKVVPDRKLFTLPKLEESHQATLPLPQSEEQQDDDDFKPQLTPKFNFSKRSN